MEFTFKQLHDFFNDHIVEKLQDERLIKTTGIDLENFENFKHDFKIFELAFMEGLASGINLANGKIINVPEIDIKDV